MFADGLILLGARSSSGALTTNSTFCANIWRIWILRIIEIKSLLLHHDELAMILWGPPGLFQPEWMKSKQFVVVFTHVCYVLNHYTWYTFSFWWIPVPSIKGIPPVEGNLKEQTRFLLLMEGWSGRPMDRQMVGQRKTKSSIPPSTSLAEGIIGLDYYFTENCFSVCLSVVQLN